jgi:hypothetical protein
MLIESKLQQEDAMKRFIQRFGEKIIGVVGGFDRLVLRGTLRSIAYPFGMMGFLWHKRVPLKDFGGYVRKVTEGVKESSCRHAESRRRPVEYLTSAQTDKAAIAEGIRQRDGVDAGLIAVISCVEPCLGYDVASVRGLMSLVLRQRKCLFLYHYLIHPKFGFMSARIQSWFPFNIQVCINGREWLARQMDRAGIKYRRRENCFPWIENVEAAQKLMDQQLKTDWSRELNQIARMLNPVHEQIFEGFPVNYYWSTFASEWATDIMFRDPSELARIYRPLVLHGITTYCSRDVMRFLGKRLHSDSETEIVSDYKHRLEGVRIKHRAGKNSVKLYDKQGSVLRTETTINDPQAFKVFRRKENDPAGEQKWRPVRRGIADLYRVAQISQASNERYLDALASADTSTALGKLTERICAPTKWNGRRVRALHPTSAEDLNLLTAISRGEFAINGFRNKDLQNLLFQKPPVDKTEKRRRSSKMTRLIRLLRAHHLLRKVPGSHRYLLTPLGRDITVAVLAVQRITLEQLNRIVA